jgi:hypothetical protein
MYAALTTAALFTGVILNDLYSAGEPLKHFLFGLVGTAVIGTLEQRGFVPVAWGLLIVPLAIISSVFISILWVPPVTAPSPAPAPVPVPKPEPKPEPLVQLPDTPFRKTVCEEVDAQPSTYVPPAPVQCSFATDGTPMMPAPPPTVGPLPSVPSTMSPTASQPAPPEVTTSKQLNVLADAVKLNLTPVTTCA